MKDRLDCLFCSAVQSVDKTKEDQIFEIPGGLGFSVEVSVNVWTCSACGEAWQDDPADKASRELSKR
jgi:rubrerythrin